MERILGWNSNLPEDELLYGMWKKPALNAVVDRYLKGIRPEISDSMIAVFDGALHGLIECSQDIVFFIYDQVNEESKIVKVPTTSFSIADGTFNDFDVKVLSFGSDVFGIHPIMGTSKYDINGNLVISWFDGVLDNMRGLYLFNWKDYGEFYTSEYNNLQSKPDLPELGIKLTEVKGNLPQGTYEFAIQFEYTLNDLSNVVDITNPFYIYLDKDASQGDLSNSAIAVDIVNLSAQWFPYRLLVIKTIDGITTVDEVGRYYRDAKVIYNGQKTSREVTLNEVLIDNAMVVGAMAGTNVNNALILGNIKELDIDAKVQQYVSNWKVAWKAVEVTPPLAVTEANEDNNFGEKIHIQKGLMPNEVYALYVSFKYIKGGYSKAFPLIGRKAEYLFYKQADNIELISATLGGPGGNFILLNFVSTPSLVAAPVNAESVLIINGIQTDIIGKISLSPTVVQIGINNISLNYLVAEGWFSAGDLGVFGYRNESAGIKEDVEIGTSPYPHYDDTAAMAGDYGSTTIPYYVVENTAYKGLFGVWNNPNEVYEGEQFEDIIGYSGSTGVNLRGKEVRHFRAPNFKELTNSTTGDSINKVIGIKLYDVVIPTELSGLVSGYRILYAVRDGTNNLVISNGVVREEFFDTHPNASNYGKTYPENKYMDYDKPGYRFTSYETMALDLDVSEGTGLIVDARLTGERNADVRSSGDPGFEYTVDGWLLKTFSISNLQYVLENNTAMIPTNEFREKTLRFNSTVNFRAYTDGETYPSFYIDDPTIGDAVYTSWSRSHIMYQVSLIRLRQNLYVKVHQQNLAHTNSVIRITDIGIPKTSGTTIFGFDTSLSEEYERYAEQTGIVAPTAPWQVGWWSTENYLGGVTAYNALGVRAYYRTYSIAPQILNQDDGSTTITQRKFSRDYLRMGNFKVPGVNENKTLESNGWKPYKVIKSQVGSGEEVTESWRTFLINDYTLDVRNRGAVVRLDTFNKNVLIVHYEHGLYTAEVKYTLQTDDITAYLGTGDLFDQPLAPVLDTKQNHLGVDGKYAGCITPYGYVFQYRGRAYLFTGGQVNEISEPISQDYFKFIGSQFLRVHELDIVGKWSYDNPYTGIEPLNIAGTCILTYDPHLDRLICQFTRLLKKSVVYYYTFTYSFLTKSWIGYHKYYPNMMFVANQRLFKLTCEYSGMNIPEEDFILMTLSEGGKTILEFPHTDYCDFYVDLVLTPDKKVVTVFDAIQWFQENYSMESGARVRRNGFTHIMIYNRDQCSGYVPLIYSRRFGDDTNAFYEPNVFDNRGGYMFADFKVAVTTDDSAIITETDFLTEIGDILGLTPPDHGWYEYNRFESNYIVVRFAVQGDYGSAQITQKPYLTDCTIITSIE